MNSVVAVRGIICNEAVKTKSQGLSLKRELLYL
jgi:hypothetical protein